MGDIIASALKSLLAKAIVQSGPIAVSNAIMGALKLMSPVIKKVDIELVVTRTKGFFIVNGEHGLFRTGIMKFYCQCHDANLEEPNNERRVCMTKTMKENHVVLC